MTKPTMPTKPGLTLGSGALIPRIGLGTWLMDDEQAYLAVLTAVELGYRHLDTAENYRNETGVGRAVRDCGLPRDDLFVTTKFNREWHGDARGGLAGNLERLGLDRVDLLLIHWPNPDQDRYVQAWQTMLTLREEGLTRAIGVSNFTVRHLRRLIDETGVAPEINQVEAHPFVDTSALRAYHAEHGIATAAWSPLGRRSDLLQHPDVTGAAQRLGVGPGQVVLAWELAQDMVVIPKSTHRERLLENLGALDVRLDEPALAALSRLGRATWGRLDPETEGN